jgi:iron complex outermembrane receptor protein
MKSATQPSSLSRNPLVLACRVLALMCLLPFTGFAQASSSGAIEGRVFNTATQSYVRNVRIEVVGTTLQTFTDDFGGYALSGVPVGAVTLRLFYTGTGEHTIQVNVPAGQAVRRDLSISGREFLAEDRETVALDTFIVAEARQMDTRVIAINEQRFADNLKTVAAADAFGDSVDGNVNEFIKNMPGITIDGSGVSVRGLPGSMTPVSIDGADLASSSGIKDTRAIGLSNLAINNISRVEVTKSPTPDMAAKIGRRRRIRAGIRATNTSRASISATRCR